MVAHHFRSYYYCRAKRELRMREWPSIVPAAPEDYYIVVNHYGRFGTAFAENRPRPRQL